MEETCLFCLEPAKKNKIENPVRCKCRTSGHEECFQKWFDSKGHVECPICHTITFPNPLQPVVPFVVYVNARPINNFMDRRRRVLFVGMFMMFLIVCAAILLFFIVKTTREN